jgi:hypothetical protein
MQEGMKTALTHQRRKNFQGIRGMKQLSMQIQMSKKRRKKLKDY